MKRTSVGVAASMILVGSLLAEQSPSRPKGPQPFQVAVRAETGQLLVPQVVQEFRRETRTRTVTRNGEEKQEKYTVRVPVFHEQIIRIPLKNVQAYDTAGNKITAEDLADRLKKDTIVLISADGKKVDPFYLRIIKANTLVLLLPPPKAPLPEPAPTPPRPTPPKEPADR